MADEEAKRNGAKWLIVILIVSVVFAVLIIAAYINNSFKRDSHDTTVAPIVNKKG